MRWRNSGAGGVVENPSHLWSHHIRFSFKVYNPTLDSVLVYGDILCSIMDVSEVLLESSDNIGGTVTKCIAVLDLETCTLTEIIDSLGLQRLGKTLGISTDYPLFCAIFELSGQCWNKRRDDHAVTWCKGVKNLTSVFASICASRFPSRSSRDEDYCPQSYGREFHGTCLQNSCLIEKSTKIAKSAITNAQKSKFNFLAATYFPLSKKVSLTVIILHKPV